MSPNTKRMIWIPLVIGVIAGLLVVTADAVEFRVPSGYTDDMVDSREIFYSLCAALTGPLGMLAAQAVGWFLNPTLRGFQTQSNLFSNFLTHCVQGAWMVFAYKFIYDRLKPPVLQVVAWVGSMLVYYYVLYTISILVVDGIPAADFMKVYAEIAGSLFSEFVITTVLTTLILFFALSKKFRKPLWYEPKLNSEPSNTMNKEEVVA